MKALPCQNTTKQGEPCPGSPRARGVVALPNGEPYLIAQPSAFPLVAKCAKCKLPNRFTAAEFASLPEVTVAQLAAMKQLEPLTKDWRGAGLPDEHAADMLSAGLMGPSSVEARAEVVPPTRTWRTGRKCPISGVYHSGETTIPLSKGERFPPYKNKGAEWTLERTA